MKIRLNFMATLCRNPGNSKGFTNVFLPLYLPASVFSINQSFPAECQNTTKQNIGISFQTLQAFGRYPKTNQTNKQTSHLVSSALPQTDAGTKTRQHQRDGLQREQYDSTEGRCFARSDAFSCQNFEGACFVYHFFGYFMIPYV